MTTPDYTKFSEITVNDLINYLRLVEITEADRTLLSSILSAARSYILTFTGRTIGDADTFPEFTIATYVIAEDLYDKRTYIVDSETSNKIVDNILGSRSLNLL